MKWWNTSQTAESSKVISETRPWGLVKFWSLINLCSIKENIVGGRVNEGKYNF